MVVQLHGKLSELAGNLCSVQMNNRNVCSNQIMQSRQRREGEQSRALNGSLQIDQI